MVARKKSLAAGLIVTFAACALVIGQEFEISRYTIDGGGVMRSVGVDFELSGTIGQPDAGVLSGGGFELTGGFWFALAPGDCNDDGTVGLSDYYSFQVCLSGPDAPTTDGCACFDLDRDGTVDLADFALSQSNFTGE